MKGVNFEHLRDAGDIVELAARYSAEGADELVFLDITASSDNTSFVQAFVTSKKLLIVVRTVFSTLPKSKNSPVML